MARYRLLEDADRGVSIEVTQVAGKEEELLGAFGACQAGRCSCPTDEYRKLAAMSIDPAEDGIRLRLTPRPGERFDLTQVGACLDQVTGTAAEDI